MCVHACVYMFVVFSNPTRCIFSPNLAHHTLRGIAGLGWVYIDNIIGFRCHINTVEQAVLLMEPLLAPGFWLKQVPESLKWCEGTLHLDQGARQGEKVKNRKEEGKKLSGRNRKKGGREREKEREKRNKKKEKERTN